MKTIIFFVNTNIGDKMETILITGARSGIMKQLIEKIRYNYKIYLTVHTENQYKRVKEYYKDYKNIICMKLDITNELDRNKVKDLDIDILISNASIGNGGSVASMEIDRIRENFEVNVFSNFSLVQLVLKNMIKKDKGKVIMMSSLASILPIPFLGSYCSTKASISMLSSSLKKELKCITKNIKIVLIEPGMYHTGFNQVMLENKYDNMDLFKDEINLIRKKENLFFNLIEKKNLDSIVNKIYNAVISDDSKFIYRAPLFQVIGVKLYQLFKT